MSARRRWGSRGRPGDGRARRPIHLGGVERLHAWYAREPTGGRGEPVQRAPRAAGARLRALGARHHGRRRHGCAPDPGPHRGDPVPRRQLHVHVRREPPVHGRGLRRTRASHCSRARPRRCSRSRSVSPRRPALTAAPGINGSGGEAGFRAMLRWEAVVCQPPTGSTCSTRAPIGRGRGPLIGEGPADAPDFAVTSGRSRRVSRATHAAQREGLRRAGAASGLVFVFHGTDRVTASR